MAHPPPHNRGALLVPPPNMGVAEGSSSRTRAQGSVQPPPPCHTGSTCSLAHRATTLMHVASTLRHRQLRVETPCWPVALRTVPLCGSQDSAYYQTYRRQLRPSSWHGPRHPPRQVATCLLTQKATLPAAAEGPVYRGGALSQQPHTAGWSTRPGHMPTSIMAVACIHAVPLLPLCG
jgi:hypothetical protein